MISAVLVVEPGTDREEVDRFTSAGGKMVVLSADLAKGPPPFTFPDDVLVIDLRYKGGVNMVRGKHPRSEGHWTQYGGLETGLARNITISHVVTDKTPIENAKSGKHKMQRAPYGEALASEDYSHQHNHYQNVLVETWNFSKDLNAVSIWGDSGAFYPGAKSWGGFFSARSWPVRWAEYTPKAKRYKDEELDCQLIGIEVDILNAGRPWPHVAPGQKGPLAKVGLQVVGFGNRNTAALEVRTEDTDDPERDASTRRGAWQWGIIMRNALGDDSTVLKAENGHILRGIDFDGTTFAEGAMRLNAGGPKSGLVFDGGAGGEIYSEQTQEGPRLNIKVGAGGLRFYDEAGNVLLQLKPKRRLFSWPKRRRSA